MDLEPRYRGSFEVKPLALSYGPSGVGKTWLPQSLGKHLPQNVCLSPEGLDHGLGPTELTE